MKTISRWRQRGLSGLRVLDQDKVSRLVFTERALQRFVSRNRELVLRGAAFRQLTEVQRQEMIERARTLVADRRLKMQDVARAIADETNRPVETIRYTLRRHDESCPQSALFGLDGQPRIPESYTEVYRSYRQRRSIAEIAKTHGLTQKAVERICTEMRAYELLDRKLTYVYHPEFDAPDAKEYILNRTEPVYDADQTTKVAAPADAPAYLRSLYDVPLLTRAQEQDLFRRYNYCKYRAALLIKQLEPCKATRKQLKSIADLLRRSDRFQQRIIRANLRLVVSIANKHIRRATNIFELISDGNVSLMRAVERFDYSRGFKLSTYASWAIMKNFARTIPEERERYTRYVTGRDELLDTAPDRSIAAEVGGSTETEGLRTALVDGLSQLDEREREIVTRHYGLGADDAEPTTLEKLGVRFGVTKERIRQIEKRALSKLRKLVSPSLAEHLTDL